jgi:hypothetical protein
LDPSARRRPISPEEETVLTNIKCPACGAVNYATSEACRRCEAVLARTENAVRAAPVVVDDGERSFGRWLLWIAGVFVTMLTSAYASLLLTSEPVRPDERVVVMEAIRVLAKAGFSSEASALRRYVSFRRTDNWWNAYVGHPTAYAATNFPFAVITIYPTFFKYPVDEIERATILLHESYHLFGDDEKLALHKVWLAKDRLGWTAPRYGHTRVWKNTREWTAAEHPGIFTCGEDKTSDCLE